MRGVRWIGSCASQARKGASGGCSAQTAACSAALPWAQADMRKWRATAMTTGSQAPSRNLREQAATSRVSSTPMLHMSSSMGGRSAARPFSRHQRAATMVVKRHVTIIVAVTDMP